LKMEQTGCSETMVRITITCCIIAQKRAVFNANTIQSSPHFREIVLHSWLKIYTPNIQ